MRSCQCSNLCLNSVFIFQSSDIADGCSFTPGPWTSSFLLSEDAQVPATRKERQRNEVWSGVWQDWRLLCPLYACELLLLLAVHPSLPKTFEFSLAWILSHCYLWTFIVSLSLELGVWEVGWATEKRVRKKAIIVRMIKIWVLNTPRTGQHFPPPLVGG